MRHTKFADVLSEIANAKTDYGEDPQHLLQRIYRILGDDTEAQQGTYEMLRVVEQTFLPSWAGVPQGDSGADVAAADARSMVEILLQHSDELSSEPWFACRSSEWLAVIAADRLGHGLFLDRWLRRTLASTDGEPSSEILEHLQLVVPKAYAGCREALIAAEVVRSHAAKSKARRISQARQGGQAKNRKYQDAVDQFVEYYGQNSHLSRREAARRFLDENSQTIRKLYTTSDSGIRALCEGLRRRFS